MESLDNPLIYLDNAATAWPKPESVYRFMIDFYRSTGVNPGRSGFDLALEAGSLLDNLRQRLTRFFGGDEDAPEHLSFGYNATDALNLAIPGPSGCDHAVFPQQPCVVCCGGPLFTLQLKNLSYSGSAIAMSDGCSVQVRSVQGSSFNGRPGTTALAVTISGVGPVSDVASTSSTPLTSWTQNVTVGSGTATVTYNDSAILYTPGSTPTPPSAVPTLSQ